MIIQNDEQALRVKCEDVKENEIYDLISILEKELEYSNRFTPGIGLAAPQIGIAKKIAIVRLGNIKIDLVNAKLEKGYDEKIFIDESCLSLPGKSGNTLRYQEVYITNNLAHPHSFIATGLTAVVCQHELDHLNSTLFVDRIVKEKQKSTIKQNPNEPCLCGSNKKYKRCCYQKE